ncbi:MAG TPA: hypothetical protein VLB27_08345 [candidate division Zixibacteria bacterium]|nr:hypothetical protein [candidate division Zixibacteria bacterium]
MPGFVERMDRRAKQLQLVVPLAIAAALSACGGGLETLIPAETLQRAKTWRIAHHYDIKTPAAPNLQATAEQRALAASVRAFAEPQITLAYVENNADITVTLERGFQQAGYGQISGLTRRETIWWVRFLDTSGKKLGEFVERNQHLTEATNSTELARKLAGDIAAALNAR